MTRAIDSDQSQIDIRRKIYRYSIVDNSNLIAYIESTKLAYKVRLHNINKSTWVLIWTYYKDKTTSLVLTPKGCYGGLGLLKFCFKQLLKKVGTLIVFRKLMKKKCILQNYGSKIAESRSSSTHASQKSAFFKEVSEYYHLVKLSYLQSYSLSNIVPFTTIMQFQLSSSLTVPNSPSKLVLFLSSRSNTLHQRKG